MCHLSAEAKVQCSCFENRSLLPDEKRCVASAAPNCTEDNFQCSDRGCIPYHLTCDGIPHCIDLSDEDETYCSKLSQINVRRKYCTLVFFLELTPLVVFIPVKSSK